MISGDTIAALSSAAGTAHRIIVRLSGPDAFAIAARFWAGDLPGHAAAARGKVLLNTLQVPSWCYAFKSPRSYTAEDTIELHIPGNALLARMLLSGLLHSGARAAEPGEFTARAFFNGRIDLTEAEGVAATIAAGTEKELSAAQRLLSGELARRVGPAIEFLASTLALIEVGIDFSDEDVTFLQADEVEERIAMVDEILAKLLAESSRFERLAHEPSVVLVGRPNAGKSTLLNALAGQDRAVVSSEAGTTRDVLSAEIALPHGIIRLSDVAGLSEPANAAAAVGQSEQDLIESKMQSQALRAITEADHVVLVRDTSDSRPVIALPRAANIAVWSKCDLTSMQRGGVNFEGGPDVALPRINAQPTLLSRWLPMHPSHTEPAEGAGPRAQTLRLSALTGDGLPALRTALDRLCFGETSAVESLSLNARHVKAIDEARASLARAAGQVHCGPEFIALELRQALDALGEITGLISPDDLLGRVFSHFCIGK